MQTKTLIQSQANIIRITNLKIGDVVKLVDDEYSSIKVKYAVVLDLLNDGNKTYVQFLEYEKSYSDSIETNIKTYGGDKDLSIFPAKPDEVKEFMQGTLARIEESIKKEEKDLADKKDGYEKAKKFVSGELSKTLSEPEFEVEEPKQLD